MTNENPTPTRAQAEQAVSAMLDASEPGENLVTRVQVGQYASWRARFDDLEGARAAAGITNTQLFLGSENTLLVLADVPGLREARAWADGGWRAGIPADEVEGSPTVYFGTGPDQEAAGGDAAVTAPQAPLKGIGHLRVKDFAKYHELFLKMENSRASDGGLTNPVIYHSSEDENELLIVGDVADVAQFRAWLVEDAMTGYPAETGAGSGKFRFAVEL
jgi:hypothetical protein